MFNVKDCLPILKSKGWTNTSIAEAVGVTVNAVEKWQSGDRNISNSRLILLNQLLHKKNIPVQKRHQINKLNGENHERRIESKGTT